MLNEVAITALCEGNCEADVDQMVLEFPVMADYCVLQLEDTGVVLHPTDMCTISVYASAEERRHLLNGHTHVPACENSG